MNQPQVLIRTVLFTLLLQETEAFTPRSVSSRYWPMAVPDSSWIRGPDLPLLEQYENDTILLRVVLILETPGVCSGPMFCATAWVSQIKGHEFQDPSHKS